MDKEKISTLLFMASASLAISVIIFLFVAIFGGIKSNWVLCAALVCTFLANLFNVIRVSLKKKRNKI